jgi:polyisoprenoid-binding protein YceI
MRIGSPVRQSRLPVHPADSEEAPMSAHVLPYGTWAVDPSHSSVNFAVRHLGISKVRGRFGDFSGSIAVSPDLARGVGTIGASSVQTGDDVRDQHLRSSDFLNAGAHPTITYDLLAVHRDGDEDFAFEGDLTINGVTRPIRLEASSGGLAIDPEGMERAALELEGAIRRRDFNLAYDGLEKLIGDKIELELDLSLIKTAT